MRDRSSSGHRFIRLARALTLVAPLLAVGAFALLGWGDEPFAPTPELDVWMVLVAAQVAAWTIFMGIGIRGLGALDTLFEKWPSRRTLSSRRSWRQETGWFLALVYGTLSLLLVLGYFADIRNEPLLAWQEWKIPLLHVVAGIAAFPFFVGLKWIQLCAEEDTIWSTTAADIERLKSFRRYLRTATAAMGTVVALAVVSTGALRTAVEAAEKTPLPEEFVIIYGAFLSGVVGATYIYVFGSIEARGRSMLQVAVPLPDPDLASADQFSAATKMRGELAQELELGGDPRTNLEGLIAVFAPLIGALITGVGGLRS
jgi:hypothetical protein